MRKIVFLDRDGVIINNSKHYYIYKLSDISFVPGIFSNLKELASKGFQFIIISNQSGIAKGEYTHKEVDKVHETIQKKFSENKLTLLDAYFCPHHPTKTACLCRKPDSLMLEKAIAVHNVNIEQSFLIGDSDTDIKAAKKIGLKAIKIEANKDWSNLTINN